MLENKLKEIQCHVKVFNMELHLMQVEMLKISSIYETISQAFLGRKDDDDNDF